MAEVMADIKKVDLQYLKEAVKEPVNFWGMAGFAVAAAYTGSIIPLGAALVTEGLYLATVPANALYRRLVDTRTKKHLFEMRRRQREKLIDSFDPREREAMDMQLQDKLLEYKQGMGLLPSSTGKQQGALPAASEDQGRASS